MWRRVTFQMVKGDGLPSEGSRSGRQASCGAACADGCLHYILSAKLHNFSVKSSLFGKKCVASRKKNIAGRHRVSVSVQSSVFSLRQLASAVGGHPEIFPHSFPVPVFLFKQSHSVKMVGEFGLMPSPVSVGHLQLMLQQIGV